MLTCQPGQPRAAAGVVDIAWVIPHSAPARHALAAGVRHGVGGPARGVPPVRPPPILERICAAAADSRLQAVQQHRALLPPCHPVLLGQTLVQASYQLALNLTDKSR